MYIYAFKILAFNVPFSPEYFILYFSKLNSKIRRRV